MISAATVLYACGWDSTTRRRVSRPSAVERPRGYHNSGAHPTTTNGDSNAKTAGSSRGVRTALLGTDKTVVGSSLDVNVTVNGEALLDGRQRDRGAGNQATVASPGDSGAGASTGADARPPPLSLSDEAVRAVVNAVERYAASARRILKTDEIGVQKGHPLQVRHNDGVGAF